MPFKRYKGYKKYRMSKKQIIVAVSIAAFFASIILPFKFQGETESFNQTLSISSSLISAFFSILAFLLAFLLFNKFGIDNSLLEKRTDVVFRLLNQINGLVYSIENERYFFTLSLGSSERKNIEEYYGVKVSFSNEYFNDIEKLFEIVNSPFTPKSIVAKMEPLRNQILSFDVSDVDKINYAKVYAYGHRNENDQFGRMNHTDMTLYDFIVSYTEIKETIVTWIKENTTIKTLDLNI